MKVGKFKKFRIERDSLGEMRVPENAYYGPQTSRSIENFKISGARIDEEIIKSVLYLKIACAKANIGLGLLDEKKGEAIVLACREIIKNFPKFKKEFPIDVFQSGSGTSTNMNVNEVVANKAVEILTGQRKNFGKKIIHPNDDVNKGQSTNDIFPSAIKIAAIIELEKLIASLKNLGDALKKKGEEFKNILKAGRTHLQDAVPITLGQEFEAYAFAILKDIKRVEATRKFLLELPIGGNAVGTGLNTSKNFRKLIIKNLNAYFSSQFKKKSQFKICKNGVEAIQFLTDLAMLSSTLKLIAIDLNKISNDLRLLNSGPRTGFNEISLPAVEPGSSMMPGKINPSICEAINQICFKVMGNELTITNSCAAGQLELNTHLPVIAKSLIESLKILTEGINIFVKKAIKGIKANKERCQYYAENSLSLVTALNPILGYDKCAEIVKESLKSKKTIKEIILEKRYLSQKEVKKFLNPKFLTKPVRD